MTESTSEKMDVCSAADLAEGETLGLRTLTSDRGDITGADGSVLVTERPVLRYGLDKTKVEGAQVARSARRIARVLDIDAGAYVDRAGAMGPEAFVEAVVLREDDAREVLPAFRRITGALAVNDTLLLIRDAIIRLNVDKSKQNAIPPVEFTPRPGRRAVDTPSSKISLEEQQARHTKAVALFLPDKANRDD